MAQNPPNQRAREAQGLAQGDALAMAVAVGWVVVMGIFFWLAWPDATAVDVFAVGRLVLVLIAVFVPAALILVMAASHRSVRNLRDELFEAQAGIDRIADAQAAHAALARALAEQLTAAQPAAEQTPAAPPPPDVPPAAAEPPVTGFASRREVSRLIVPRAAPQAPADQPALALDNPPDAVDPPIEHPDLIKALHFPDDENDNEGFAALRRALRDRNARKLVQASQDVLTLLSQNGIYMDDLRPEPVSADMWRRFAKGERGKPLDRLGGIRDQAYLSVLSTRMREDTIFRDSVHHFLRCFDQLLMTFEEYATDTDLLELAETRTSRAFMLLARATGTFD